MNFKKIIISIVVFVFIFAVIVFAQAKINLSKIPNGTYLGNYKATYKGTRQGDHQLQAKSHSFWRKIDESSFDKKRS